ncbi:MAG: hypothetical protein WCH34_10090 [Bacteroidota bacterium]
MKKTITKMFMAVCFAVISVTTGFAQINDLNNGAECGCPAVNTRTVVDLATLSVPLNANQSEIQVNTTLTCDKVYTFDRKIFVGYGVTLTIQPGTVLKGVFTNDPVKASAIIVERGGKIIADGKPNCKIIMTGMADPLDGTYSITNVGDWGGFVICGMAPNNLLKAYNQSGKGSIWNGVGYIEGSDNTVKTMWGAGDTITTVNGTSAFIPTTFNVDDNSGILRYVSVRHAGALIGGNTAGNELNGISLYSVGRGTKIEYCETVAAADDNFELFGGNVDLKHCSVLYGDDDFFDYDLGWSGRMQFCFGMAGDSITGLHSTDNGYEADTDDQSAAKNFPGDNHTFTPWSLPQIYNTTLISNGHVVPAADNTGPAAIQAKEITGGTFVNNVFVNFRSGLHVAQARSNATAKGDAYDNWTDDVTNPYLTTNGGVARYHSLIVKNNTFVHCNQGTSQNPNGYSYWITKGTMTTSASPNYLYKDATPASAADTLQFFNDGNTHPASVPGIDYLWAWNSGHTDFANKFHAVPSASLTSTMTPPNDGFFDIVSFRGAFDPSKPSWLSTANGFAIPVADKINSDNPTDLNNDGITNIDDFSIFIAKYGQLDQ